MANGRIYRIDSVYVERQILRKCYELLKMQGFEGALLEFEKSRVNLEQGDYQSAIQNANLSVESTIKSVLEIEKAKPGDLYRLLRESKLIPEYYEGFLKAFERHMIRCPAVCRNEEGGAGHGQGPSVNVIPRPLAEFTINMAAVLINFILNLHTRKEDDLEDEEESFEDEVVF
jgi:Abortive infection C-terminus